jgi:hypothetical protein
MKIQIKYDAQLIANQTFLQILTKRCNWFFIIVYREIIKNENNRLNKNECWDIRKEKKSIFIFVFIYFLFIGKYKKRIS